MLDQFNEFENILFENLNCKNPAHRGIAIQQERFIRDKKHFFYNTFKNLIKETPDIKTILDKYILENEAAKYDLSGWGELHQFIGWLMDEKCSFEHKQKIYFFLSCLAAQQIERSLDKNEPPIPKLNDFLSEFCIFKGSIWISSYGYLNKRYKLAGPLRLTSKQGKISIQTSTEIFNHYSPSRNNDIFSLASKHNWIIPEEKHHYLKKNDAFINFFSFSNFEFIALAKELEMQNEINLINFAKTIFPIWLPNSMGLTLSYYCNASCSHCYNSSGPNRERKTLTWSEISNAMSFYKKIGVDEIGISGGEPFLFFENLIDVIDGLKKLGIQRIVPFTNGFWGNDLLQAENFLIRLKNIGFGLNKGDQIKISVGEYHQKDIDLDYALNIAELHYKILNKKAIFDIEQVEDPKLAERIIKKAKQRNISSLIDWQLRQSLSDSGRGKAIINRVEQKPLDLKTLKCPVKSRGAVYADHGWVYCTGTVFPKKHLVYGSIHSDLSACAQLSIAQYDSRMPYWQFGNFQNYVEDYNEKIKDTRIPENIAKNSTPCGVCSKIFKK